MSVVHKLALASLFLTLTTLPAQAREWRSWCVFPPRLALLLRPQ